jgi:hypothetical protein
MGIAVPAIVYGILFLLIGMIPTPTNGSGPAVKTSTVQLISIFSNLIIMRYYLMKLKFDFTGRGILLSTFILGIAYFAIHL